MTVLQAAGMVGVISICNGLGRVFWAWVSDSLGRARVYLLLYLIQAVIFFVLPHIRDLTLFTAAFALIGLCFPMALICLNIYASKRRVQNISRGLQHKP